MPANARLKYVSEPIPELPRELVLDGLCRDGDVDLFFREDELSVKLAKRICADCPVQSSCRTYAVSAEEFGVWGGTTPAERNRIRGRKFVSRDLRIASQRAARMLAAGSTKEQVAAAFEVNVRTVYRFAADMARDQAGVAAAATRAASAAA